MYYNPILEEIDFMANRKYTFALFILLIFSNTIYSQNNNDIYSVVDHEIIIKDNWAGQSLTLVKEGSNYYIIRKIFGSGVPIVEIIKYNVRFNSDYKITTLDIESIQNNSIENYGLKETFEIYFRNNKIEVYLNGLKIEILE
ncbi:hypothetical protein FACS189485_22090 [Spirochaetia bacterium]|nr:hypothetical protein FACS189485_22090 [Spirochaetia bacterium]